MDRDPGDFEPDSDDAMPASAEDAMLSALPFCPGLPDSEADIAQAISEARADIVAGRVYSHDVVSEWLRTWGTPDRKSFWDWLAVRNG